MTSVSPAPAPEREPQGGLFLAFEGVEGSGTSTQSALLAERLRDAGMEVVLAREPGSTPLGERVRSVVLNDPGLTVPALSEMFLMLAARAAFVEDIVRPGLDAGKVVIADRFELSTLAYQGAGRGLPLDEIVRCNRTATGGLSPHVTFLLDLDPEEGARRQMAAAKRPDRMEAEAREFHRRVAAGYRDLASMVTGLTRIDARGTVDDVRDQVLRSLVDRFPRTFDVGGFIS